MLVKMMAIFNSSFQPPPNKLANSCSLEYIGACVPCTALPCTALMSQFHWNHTISTQFFCATCCVDSFGPSVYEISFDHSTNSSIWSLDIIFNKMLIFPTVSYSHNLWMTHHEFKCIAMTNLLSIDHSTLLQRLICNRLTTPPDCWSLCVIVSISYTMYFTGIHQVILTPWFCWRVSCIQEPTRDFIRKI